MKAICYIGIISSFLFSCKQNHEACEFEGTYETNGSWYETTLIVRLDHSFKMSATRYYCLGGQTDHVVTGTFTAKDDKLLLSPSAFHVIQYERDSTTNPVIYDSILSMSSIFKRFREYKDTLQILRWNHRLFVLTADRRENARADLYGYSNELIALLNIYNRNPDAFNYHDNHQRSLVSFWNKACAECTEMDIRKTLPTNWVGYLLNAPITAEITNVKEAEGDHRIIKTYTTFINVGSTKNVRPGMLFYVQPYKKSADNITITDVFDNDSKGRVTSSSDIKPIVGTKLTTQPIIEDVPQDTLKLN